jgi:hypothetical protein
MSYGDGWLEVSGAGQVHPNVLRAVSIDQTISGFRLRHGSDRLAMLVTVSTICGCSTKTICASAAVRLAQIVATIVAHAMKFSSTVAHACRSADRGTRSLTR